MRKFVIGILVGALIVTATVAAATIPDSSGIIHGCYLTSGNPNVRGALRVIDTEIGESCGNGETAIAWDSTAPDGTQDLGYRQVVATRQLQTNGDGSTNFADCGQNGVAVGGGYSFATEGAGYDGPFPPVLVTAIGLDGGQSTGSSRYAVNAHDAGPNDGNTVFVTVTAVCLSLEFSD